jgi:hypothetical protein
MQSAVAAQRYQSRLKQSTALDTLHDSVHQAMTLSNMPNIPTAEQVKTQLVRAGRAHSNNQFVCCCEKWVQDRVHLSIADSAGIISLVMKEHTVIQKMILQALQDIKSVTSYHGQYLQIFLDGTFIHCAAVYMVYNTGATLARVLAGSCPFLSDNPHLLSIVAPYTGATAWSESTSQHVFGFVTALIVQASASLSPEAVKPRVSEASSMPPGFHMPRYTDIWTDATQTHPNKVCNIASHQQCNCRLFVVSVPQTETTRIRFCHRYTHSGAVNILEILQKIKSLLPELWAQYIEAPGCGLFMVNCTTPLQDIRLSAGVKDDMFMTNLSTFSMLALTLGSQLHNMWKDGKVPFHIEERNVQHTLLSLDGVPTDCKTYEDVQKALLICTEAAHCGVPIINSVVAMAYVGVNVTDNVVYPERPRLSVHTAAAETIRRLMSCVQIADVRIRYICTMRWPCMQARKRNRCSSCCRMPLHQFLAGPIDLPSKAALSIDSPHWICAHTEHSDIRDAFLSKRDEYWKARVFAERSNMHAEDSRAAEMKALERARAALNSDHKSSLTTLSHLHRLLKEQYAITHPAWSSRENTQIAKQDASLIMKRDVRMMMEGSRSEPEFIPLYKKSYKGNLVFNSVVYPACLRT